MFTVPTLFIASFVQLLPILLITLGGYIVARIYTVDVHSLIKIVADFFMPLLIFHALYYSDLQGNLILSIAGVTTLVVLLNTISGYAYARATGIDARSFMPATIFMNSGFLGIPLMRLWGGIAAMNIVVIFDQIQTIYIFTLGILIITGGLHAKSVKTMLRSPILWAIAGGAFVRIFSIPVSTPILTTCEFGGNAAPPLAAFALGVSLRNTKLHIDRHVIAGIILRMAGGLLFGYIGSVIFGLSGISRTVVVVSSALPAAVFTSVLPLRYGVESTYASSIVVLSTLISAITIPLTFMIAG